MVEQEVRTGFRQSAKDYAKSVGSFVGGAGIGVIGYETADFLGSNSADTIGKDIGLGTGVFFGGVTAGMNASEQAEAYARDGDKRKAIAKTIESTAEFASGSIVSGAIAGWETGTIGTLIGAGVGAIIGVAMSGSTISEVRHAYKEGHYSIDFSKFDVKPYEGFPKKEGLTEIPPVFIADSIKAMQEFREVQKERAMRYLFSMKNISNTPRDISSRNYSAMFLIPDVSHFPVLDPGKRKVLGRFEEEDPAMKLHDGEAGILTAKPLTNISAFWPYDSSFKGATRSFSRDNWNYFKQNSWKRDVFVLAQYQKNQNLREDLFATKELTPEDIVDQYWLVSLVGEGGGKRKKEKKNKSYFLPTPVFAPAPNVQNIQEVELISDSGE